MKKPIDKFAERLDKIFEDGQPTKALILDAYNKATKHEQLITRSAKIDLLEKYSLFLEKNGYTDIDWRVEEPLAIDEFLKNSL